MKILWLVNIIMPELAEHLGRKPSVFGGWLTGAMEAVRAQNHSMVICTTRQNTKHAGRHEVNGVTYYLEKQLDINELEQRFREILAQEQPDIVHVFGTEYEQCLAMARAADRERLLITIQGSLTVLTPLTYGGIPARIAKDNSLHRLLRAKHKGGESIELQKRSFERRAAAEQEALRIAKYIHGGSQWGNLVARQINPECQTFDCGLILRDPFYSELRWNDEACEKHSILAVFSYPAKGFHQLLHAMPLILKQFPDAKLHAVGQQLNLRRYCGIKRWTMNLAPDYHWYVQRLLKRYHLWDNVVFDGYLDALQMRERELKTNVFVAPAILENQCTALGEALMLGVPSVATRAGAMPEFVTDGESALLYDFEDINALANHICTIFEDRDLAEKLSQNAPFLPRKLYNREENGRKLLAIYQTIHQNAMEKEGEKQ